MDKEDRMGTTHRRSDSPQRDREDRGGSQSAKERTGQAVTDTVGRATASAKDAIDDTTKMAEGLEHVCRGVLKEVTEYTRTQPWPALAMAAGLGLLIGRLTAPPGRRARDLPSESGVHWPPRLESAS